MKNPEFAFARALGAAAQVATIQIPSEPNGSLAARVQARPGSLHFKVDLPPSAAEGPNEVDCISTLTWADARTPVAVLGICLGKLFLAVALNPLDPLTRAFMHSVNHLGALPYSVRFAAWNGELPTTAVQVDGSMSVREMFADALLSTEHMQEEASESWSELAAHAMAHGLLDEGFGAHIRARLSVRSFKAHSAQMHQQPAELSAVC